jgi:hypothetical protein
MHANRHRHNLFPFMLPLSISSNQTTDLSVEQHITLQKYRTHKQCIITQCVLRPMQRRPTPFDDVGAHLLSWFRGGESKPRTGKIRYRIVIIICLFLQLQQRHAPRACRHARRPASRPAGRLIVSLTRALCARSGMRSTSSILRSYQPMCAS